MQRISAIEHEFDGRLLKVGEAFECEPLYVETLLALGRIKPERGERGFQEESNEYQTRHMTAKRRKAL